MKKLYPLDSGSKQLMALHANPPAQQNQLEKSSQQQQFPIPSFFDIQSSTIVSFICFFVYCFAMATLLISWEDLICTMVLSSRHRTELHTAQSEIKNIRWGQSTIYGLGFGFEERQLLISNKISNENESLDNVLSYNEIMLNHRKVTVPRWKQAVSRKSDAGLEPQRNDVTISRAIHTILLSYTAIKDMQTMANDYQWNSLLSSIRSPPITDLSTAANIIQKHNNHRHAIRFENPDDVIGFDWGSCAWRHCGAVADIQESLDEIDSLLGVLEPFECIFCLDIAERALRDIMSVIPWDQADVTDVKFWNAIPNYQSIVKIDNDESNEFSQIDQEYFKVLQDLRVD